MLRPRATPSLLIVLCLLLPGSPATAGANAAAKPPAAGAAKASPKQKAAKGAKKADGPPPFAKLAMSGFKMPKAPAMGLFLPRAVWRGLGFRPRLVNGNWVEYRVLKPHHSPSTLRMSVVPQDGLPKKTDHVFEIRLTNPTGNRQWLKFLLSGSLDDPNNIQRIMVAQTGIPPIELPIHGFSSMRRVVTEDKTTGRHGPRAWVFDQRRTETIKVPAGTFLTHHVRIRHRNGAGKLEYLAEVWVAPKKVPVWGVVKSIDEKGSLFELTKVARTGATTDLPDFQTFDRPKKHEKHKAK